MLCSTLEVVPDAGQPHCSVSGEHTDTNPGAIVLQNMHNLYFIYIYVYCIMYIVYICNNVYKIYTCCDNDVSMKTSYGTILV